MKTFTARSRYPSGVYVDCYACDCGADLSGARGWRLDWLW